MIDELRYLDANMLDRREEAQHSHAEQSSTTAPTRRLRPPEAAAAALRGTFVEGLRRLDGARGRLVDDPDLSSLTPQTPWQSASLPDCGSDVSTGLKKAKAGSTQPVEAGDRVRVEVRRLDRGNGLRAAVTGRQYPSGTDPFEGGTEGHPSPMRPRSTSNPSLRRNSPRRRPSSRCVAGAPAG